MVAQWKPADSPRWGETSSPIQVRRSRPHEEAQALALLFDEPTGEAAAIASGERRARTLARALFESDTASHREILVAEREGGLIGALLARWDDPAFPVGPAEIAAVAPTVLSNYFPWEMPLLAGRLFVRSLVEFPVPPGSYHVTELHVAPAERSRGVGSRLLDLAVRRAAEMGRSRINLVTASSSPARRLYERAGFAITQSRELFCYEWLTGAPGRVFMEKRLA